MMSRKAMMTTHTTLVEVEGAIPTSTSPLPQLELTTEPRSQLLLPIVVGDKKENLHPKSLFKAHSLASSTTTTSESPPSSSSSSSTTTSSSSSSSSSTSPNEKTSRSTNSSNEKAAFNRGGEAATSIVVCGVDGTVYTLDAYTGHLRGMFASGPALFEPSSEEDGGSDNYDDNDDDDDEKDNIHAGQIMEQVDTVGNAKNRDDSKNDHTSKTAITSSASKDRILPGLDGYLYRIYKTTDDDARDEHSIQELFPAKDVVDFPISACPENANTNDKQQHGQQPQVGCGIIIASKKTTIFAIDPTTGKVRWTQDPHGGAGGRGFTAHPPKSHAARGRTVLLQREDYAVRHLDADIGHEVWKLKLGQFSPLGFDIDEEDNESDDSIHENDLLLSRKSAPAATQGRTLLNEENHGYLTFGQDGPSLMAADGISGEVLWSRRIDSDIAAIYGIGRASKWVSLETFDVTNNPGDSTSLSKRSDGISPFGSTKKRESHRIGQHGSHSYVMTKLDVGRNQLQLAGPDADHQIVDNPGSLQLVASSGRQNGHLVPTKQNLSSMSSLKRIGRLIPFGAGQVESRNQLHRLSGHDSLLLINPTNVNNIQFTHSRQLAHGYHAAEDLFPGNPLDMTMIDVRRPPPSHRTEHGLYLTWSMVAAVVMILLSVIVFFARLIILRQKRKWESIPNLNQKDSKSSEDGNSVGGFVPSHAQTLNTPSLESVNSWPTKYLPVTRSYSLGAIRRHSFSYRPVITERGRSDQNEDTSSIPGTSTPAISPNTARSKGVLSEEMSSQEKSKPSVDNIDGIPLVRYSRYTSEFKEILALGRGGFGAVFRCYNLLDGREYAIKKIRIASPLSVSGNVTKHLSQKLHRVLREVKCLALLDHPNIVRYYTAWLEVDNGVHGDDDETNTISSMFDRNSLVSGFESFSRAMQQSFLPKRNKCQQRPTKELKGLSNPLGWNNFGSFRLDESKSEASLSFGARLADTTKAVSMEDHEEDLGFTWERSKDDSVEPSSSAENHPLDVKDFSSATRDVETVENENFGVTSTKSRPAMQSSKEAEKSTQLPQALADTNKYGRTSVERHILFIQMQLCSVQTLADFLANHEARGGVVSQSSSEDSRYAVDIPLAIRLFAQIAHGVKYVHKQGLIHRDLKPQNCFIDDSGIVKVGDFGLSRSSAAGGITDFDEGDKDRLVDHNDSLSSLTRSDAENTVGVGTRAYASPEQMRGSNYDASTDVFSLGLMLFELCYPMYTSMERYKEFTCIRRGCFPAYWVSRVQTSFPTLHELLVRMISESASERPSADAVSEQIDSLLREYSVQSLDKSWGEKGALLLRVEAEETEGVLAHSMKLIKDASPCSKVLQYGLRGQASKAIMEFALDLRDVEKAAYVKNITLLLEKQGMTVRVIN